MSLMGQLGSEDIKVQIGVTVDKGLNIEGAEWLTIAGAQNV